MLPIIYYCFLHENIAPHHGMVKSMIVDPARAPTPTDNCSCASSPIPENKTIAPSGIAPKTGRTTDPTSPATEGTRRRSSEPSDIMLEALRHKGDGRVGSTAWVKTAMRRVSIMVQFVLLALHCLTEAVQSNVHHGSFLSGVGSHDML